MTKLSLWTSFRGNLFNQGHSDFVGPSTNTTLFEMTLKGRSGTPVISSEGIIYFTSFDSNLYALYPNLTTKWSFNLMQPSSTAPTIRDDGSLIVSCYYQGVYAVSPHGSFLWKFNASGYMFGSPTVARDGTIYIMSDGNDINALSPYGSLKWVYHSDYGNTSFSGTGAIGSDDTLYFTSTNLTQTWFSETIGAGSYGGLFPNGTLRWLVEENIDAIPSNLAIFNEIVYVTYGGNLVAHYPNGTLYFFKQISFRKKYFIGSIAISKRDGTIYLNSICGHVFSVTSHGSINWRSRVYDTTIASSPVLDAEENIYINADVFYLYKLSRHGSIIWSSFTNNTLGYYDVNPPSPTVGNNVLYVGLNAHKFIVIGDVKTQIPKSNLNTSYIYIFSLIFVLLGILFTIYWCWKYKSKIIKIFRRSSSDEKSLSLRFDFDDIDTSRNSYNSNDNISKNEVTNALRIQYFDSIAKSFLQKNFFPKKKSLDFKDIEEASLPINSSVNLTCNSNLCLCWKDFEVVSDKSPIIGFGSNGTVVKCLFNPSYKTYPSSSLSNVEVAIKVISKNFLKQDISMVKLLDRACGEASLLSIIESKLNCIRSFNDSSINKGNEKSEVVARKLVNDNRVIEVLGITCGGLPEKFSNVFGLRKNDFAIGIVMKYEPSGSLASFIHKRNQVNNSKEFSRFNLDVFTKIELITKVAQSIADIHSLNIVHSDIKPNNILISSNSDILVKLIDFGLSKEIENTSSHSVHYTSKTKGSPAYCAPEMLMNPFNCTSSNIDDELLAASSFSTDMYAFGITMFEVLSETKPFLGVRTEVGLCSKVHQGFRPDLSSLPDNTPSKIVSLIKSCWDRDPKKRKSAIECFFLLQLEKDKFVHDSKMSYNTSFDSSRTLMILCESDILDNPREFNFIFQLFHVLSFFQSVSTLILPTSASEELKINWLREKMKFFNSKINVVIFNEAVSQLWHKNFDDNENCLFVINLNPKSNFDEKDVCAQSIFHFTKEFEWMENQKSINNNFSLVSLILDELGEQSNVESVETKILKSRIVHLIKALLKNVILQQKL